MTGPIQEIVPPSQTVLVNNINIEMVHNILYLPSDNNIVLASCTMVHAHILHYNRSNAENYLDFKQKNGLKDNYPNFCIISPYTNFTATDNSALLHKHSRYYCML